MSVSAVGATGTTQATASSDTTKASAKNTIDYDAFLKLLVAQLANQDPLNPTDSTEYVAQFATFSGVEQSISTNRKLDSLMTVSALTQANSLIGRTATSADGTRSGQVSAVEVVDGAAYAILADGSSISLESGTSVK